MSVAVSHNTKRTRKTGYSKDRTGSKDIKVTTTVNITDDVLKDEKLSPHSDTHEGVCPSIDANTHNNSSIDYMITVAVLCSSACHFDGDLYLRPVLMEAAKGICDNDILLFSAFDSIHFNVDVSVFRERPTGLLPSFDLIIFVFSPCHPLSYWQIKDIWLPTVAHLKGAVLALLATNVDLCGNPTVLDYWKGRGGPLSPSLSPVIYSSPLTLDVPGDIGTSASFALDAEFDFGSFASVSTSITLPSHTHIAGASVGMGGGLMDSYASTSQASGVITRPLVHFMYRKYMSDINASILGTADDIISENVCMNTHSFIRQRLRRVQIESLLTIACAGTTAPSQWLKGLHHLRSNFRFIFVSLAFCRNGQLPLASSCDGCDLMNNICRVVQTIREEKTTSENYIDGYNTPLKSAPHETMVNITNTSQNFIHNGFACRLLDLIQSELNNRSLCCDERWDQIVHDGKEFYELRMELAKDKSRLGPFTEWKRETVESLSSRIDDEDGIMSIIKAEYPNELDFLSKCGWLAVYGNRRTGEVVVGTRPLCLSEATYEGHSNDDHALRMLKSKIDCLQRAKDLREKEEQKAYKAIFVIEEEERKLMKDCRLLTDKIEAANKFYANYNQIKMEIEHVQSLIVATKKASCEEAYDSKINAARELIRKLEEERLAHEERERQIVVCPEHTTKEGANASGLSIDSVVEGLTLGEQRVVLAKYFVDTWTERRLLKKEETDIDIFLRGMNGEDQEESLLPGTARQQKKSGWYKYKTVDEMNDEERHNFCLYGIVSEHCQSQSDMPKYRCLDTSLYSNVSESTIAAMNIYQLPSSIGEYPIDAPTVRSNIDKIRQLDSKIASQHLRHEELWSCEIRPLLQWRLALGVNGPIVGYTAKLPDSDKISRDMSKNGQCNNLGMWTAPHSCSVICSDDVIHMIKCVSPWNLDGKDINPSLNPDGIHNDLSYKDYMTDTAKSLESTVKTVRAFSDFNDSSDDDPTNILECEWLLSIFQETMIPTPILKLKADRLQASSNDVVKSLTRRYLKTHKVSALPLVIDLDDDSKNNKQCSNSEYEFSDLKEDRPYITIRTISSMISQLLSQYDVQRLHIEIEAHMGLWKTVSNDWGLIRAFLSVTLQCFTKEVEVLLNEMWKKAERLH